MGFYKLDPLNYYTAPGLSWDALLKHIKIDLEFFTDMAMHLFMEKKNAWWNKHGVKKTR